MGILLLCRPGLSFCQGDSLLLELAREEISHLCSPELGGRGYHEEGHLKAAHFIAEAFQEAGLKPFEFPSIQDSLSYLQAFPFPLNYIPEAQLSIGGYEQELGTDFIPFRLTGSASVHGDISDLGYGLGEIDPDNITQRIILIREGWPEEIAANDSLRKSLSHKKRVWDRLESILPYGPTALLIGRKKLTAGFSSQTFPIPILEVQLDSLPNGLDSTFLIVESTQKTITGNNVIGCIEGNVFPDTAIIVSAHYDHLGKWGPALFPGANDNASGIAFLLSLLRYFSQADNRLPYTLVFIAFGGEETGLRGSRYYVQEQAIFPLSQTKFILNFDLMGNGEKGIMAVGGRDHPGYFDSLRQLNSQMGLLPSVSARPNAPNSDQYFFLKEGIPGFFIFTMGGPPHYHDVNDTAENLQLSHFPELFHLFTTYLKRF